LQQLEKQLGRTKLRKKRAVVCGVVFIQSVQILALYYACACCKTARRAYITPNDAFYHVAIPFFQISSRNWPLATSFFSFIPLSLSLYLSLFLSLSLSLSLGFPCSMQFEQQEIFFFFFFFFFFFPLCKWLRMLAGLYHSTLFAAMNAFASFYLHPSLSIISLSLIWTKSTHSWSPSTGQIDHF
jgi:hypothetical protein